MARWRLGKHLKERDWGAVVIDLLIVILGVFLGIQVSNWNDARRDDQLSRAYLERIRDDLRADLKSLSDHEEYWGEVASAGARVLDQSENGADISPWASINDLYGAGQSWNYSTNDATYSELRSAGRLDLIKDPSLRQRLGDYYVSQRDQVIFLENAEPEYRPHIRALVPFSLQRVLLEKCQRGLVKLFSDACPEPQTNIDLPQLVRKLHSNDDLIGELRTWMVTLQYMRSIGRERRNFAAQLLAKTDHALR